MSSCVPLLPLGPHSVCSLEILLPVIAQKMAKSNAKGQGDPDPLWSGLAELRAKLSTLLTNIQGVSKMVEEMQESLKDEADQEQREGKEEQL